VHQHDEGDRGHGEEVQVARAFVIADPLAEPIELHRFPDDQTGKHHHYQRGDQREIRGALRGVVDREVVMGEMPAQRLADIVQDGAR